LLKDYCGQYKREIFMLVSALKNRVADDLLKISASVPQPIKAVQIAIAIGEDGDTEVLQKFIGHPELRPLQANNPETLVRHIKWVSTAVLKSASSPASQAAGLTPGLNVPIPTPPTTAGADSRRDRRLREFFPR